MNEKVTRDLYEALRDVMRWVDSHPRKATIVESLKDRAHIAILQAEEAEEQ